MLVKDMPIQQKLMRVIILISGVVLIVTCVTFFVYEFYAFRKTTTEKLSTIGKIISTNSTAALSFDDADGAKEILAALKAEPHIMAAALYDKDGNLFSQYPSNLKPTSFPGKPQHDGYHFIHSHLEGYEPIVQDTKRLGTLYLKSDLGAMYERFRVFGIVAGLIVLVSFLLAWLLSRILQKNISKPILGLAEAARVISDHKDYSIRVVKTGNDEAGLLTDAFNNMLEQIQEQNKTLNEFNYNLEQKIKDRTAQLEAANKELEAFSYSISHDLRGPLRGIIGFASIMAEDHGSQLDDEGKRYLSIIKNNTMKMGRLIDDLLAFSRTSRQDILKSNVDTDSMIKEITDTLVTQFDTSKIEWNIRSLPTVKADINMIRQVWINLMSNAIKYSGNGEKPLIEIGSFTNDGQVVFFVKDNGVGFDVQYADKLFKVFQRLHDANEFEGTGVGLALVEKIISKHGGKVWAEAEVNKGASFYFSLPI